MDTTRRQFLNVLIAVAGASSVVAACGGDDGGGSDDGGGGGACNPVETISANHGHSVNVTAAEVAAGAMMTYDIQGSSTHSHEITIGPTLFGMLQDGRGISVESTPGPGDGHTHSVSISCA
jgi:hypothetical protein